MLTEQALKDTVSWVKGIETVQLLFG